jgi:hypothetical protein
MRFRGRYMVAVFTVGTLGVRDLEMACGEDA